MSQVVAGAGKGLPDPAPEVVALPHTDWLYHHLRITGGHANLAAFRAAAAGAGVIPWSHDLGPAAEDWFHRLAVPPTPQRRSLSLEGCRILAGQLRDAAEARQRRVAERAVASRACPLDLHRLLPVPARLLKLGPDQPETLTWLWAHWGTTQALRGVVELPVPGRGQPRRPDPALVWLSFWSADWTPWPAIIRMREGWPALRFDVRPVYDAG